MVKIGADELAFYYGTEGIIIKNQKSVTYVNDKEQLEGGLELVAKKLETNKVEHGFFKTLSDLLQ